MPLLRHVLLAVLAVAALLALGACGDDDSDADATASATPAAASEAFPVTIDTAIEPVTIDEPPTRVVALDYPSADAALALGVVPVGMYEVSYVEGGVQEWTERALRGETPELIDTLDGFPLEQIQSLRPDVILATNTFPLVEESWDRLNRIAPVVAHFGEAGADPWQQGVLQVGRALGRLDEAKRLVADAEAKVTAAREAHPEFEGKHTTSFNFVEGDGLYAINDPEDVSIRFLRTLGFAGITDEVAALDGESGRAKVSAERYDLIDADVILGTSPAEDGIDALLESPTFSRVPAVQRGAFVGLPIGPATAIAFPSVLSVPYAVDELVPKLAAALEGS